MHKAKVYLQGILFHQSQACIEVYDWVQDRWPYYQYGQTCLHIGHLVPLERSNFAYVLGSSGVVKRVLILWKNICEKLTHMHKVVYHLVVLAHLQRRRSWKRGEGGRELGLLSRHWQTVCPLVADYPRSSDASVWEGLNVMLALFMG